MRSGEKFKGNGRAITESFKRLMFHDIFMEVTLTKEFSKEEFMKLMKEGTIEVNKEKNKYGHPWAFNRSDNIPFMRRYLTLRRRYNKKYSEERLSKDLGF